MAVPLCASLSPIGMRNSPVLRKLLFAYKTSKIRPFAHFDLTRRYDLPISTEMDEFFGSGSFQPTPPAPSATAPCASGLTTQDYHQTLPNYFNQSPAAHYPAPLSHFPPPYPHPQFPLSDGFSYRRSDTAQQQQYRPAYGPYGWGGSDYLHCRPQSVHPVYQLSAHRKRPREEYQSEAAAFGAAAYQGAVANSPVGIYCTPSPPDSGIDHESPKDLTCFFPAANGQLSVKPLPLPPSPQDGVQVTLLKRDLWGMFYQAETEMIVTKTGRCLFPQLAFSVHGLSPKTEYNISIRAVLSNEQRFKYRNHQWTAVEGSPGGIQKEEKMTCKHSNSPMTGSKWMASDVNFKTVKITNTERSKNGDILLCTMHKYHFELIIEEHKSDSNPLVFSFPLTTFIAVTAYQSARMTEMKRRNNPFAKGVKGANPEAQEFAQDVSTSYRSFYN